MSYSIIVVLSIVPSFTVSYSIELIRCNLNDEKEEYYLLHRKPAIDFDNIDDEEFFNNATKIFLSENEVSDIIHIINESRVPPIMQSLVGLDGCGYSLYFFDDDGSARSSFSWWGNIPNEWYDLGRIVSILSKYFQ